MDKEQQQILANLNSNPGWKILKEEINKQMDMLRGQLENDKMVTVGEHQAVLRFAKYILRFVEHKQGEKENAK